MPFMVSIARVKDVPTPAQMPAFIAAHDAIFGDFCATPKILRDPNDSHQIAVACEVHDLEGLRAASRTPEGDAMMRKHGFLEQLSYFLDV